jgi:ribosomal peptide maturation radical SAM protein 1
MEKNFPNGEVKPTLLFETSRGCWWGEKSHCTFCGLNGQTMNFREMKPEKALTLIESLFKYSPNIEWYEAVDNIMPKRYPKEVFAALNPPPNASIFYEVKADLTEEEFAILSKARVKVVQPGIESLATSTLKLMRKGTSAYRNVTFLKHCIQYDIVPQWNILVGFPGEGEEVYKKYVDDIPWLTHLYPPSGVFPVRFDRYSPYFVQAQQYGLDLHPLDFYSLIYPFESGTLSKLAYYFEDHNVHAAYRVEMTAWIDQMRKRVDAWIERWSEQSKLPHPQLYFKDNSTVVYDSRSRRVIEHQVGPIGKRVLERLASPISREDLAKSMDDLSGFDPQRELAFLQYRGLIFQEGNRYLSLVLPHQPPKSTVSPM